MRVVFIERSMVKNYFLNGGNVIVRAKKQLWASSLCHSLVPQTIVDLSLCFVVRPGVAKRFDMHV